MTFAFVKRILGDPSLDSDFHGQRLTHLHLDNLLQWPLIKNLPDFDHLRDLRSYFQPHQEAQDLIIPWRDCRSMAGILDPYIGHYSALTTLRLTTVGKWDTSLHDPKYNYMYSSWASFLDSVRGSLRDFYFEQGICKNSYSGYLTRFTKLGPTRPMDHLFLKWIYPVLIKAAWTKLISMEIRGVGRRTEECRLQTLPPEEERSDPEVEWRILGRTQRGEYKVEITRIAFTAALREELAVHLGDRVQLKIEELVERDYEEGSVIDSWDMGIPAVEMVYW